MKKPANRYVRLPGTKRQYKDTVTGQIYSRRQYDKLISAQKQTNVTEVTTKKRGQKTLSERVDFKRKIDEYNRLVSKRQQFLADNGVMTNRQKIRTDPEFKKLLRESKKARDALKKLKDKGITLDNPSSWKDNAKAKELFRQYQIKQKELLKYVGYRQGIPDEIPTGIVYQFNTKGQISPARSKKQPWFKYLYPEKKPNKIDNISKRNNRIKGGK